MRRSTDNHTISFSVSFCHLQLNNTCRTFLHAFPASDTQLPVDLGINTLGDINRASGTDFHTASAGHAFPDIDDSFSFDHDSSPFCLSLIYPTIQRKKYLLSDKVTGLSLERQPCDLFEIFDDTDGQAPASAAGDPNERRTVGFKIQALGTAGALRFPSTGNQFFLDLFKISIHMHSPFRNRLTAAYVLSASSKDAMLIFSSIRQPGKRVNRYGEKAGEKNKIGTKAIDTCLNTYYNKGHERDINCGARVSALCNLQSMYKRSENKKGQL